MKSSAQIQPGENNLAEFGLLESNALLFHHTLGMMLSQNMAISSSNGTVVTKISSA